MSKLNQQSPLFTKKNVDFVNFSQPMLRDTLHQVKFEKIMMIQIIAKLVKPLYRGKVKSFQSNYMK